MVRTAAVHNEYVALQQFVRSFPAGDFGAAASGNVRFPPIAAVWRARTSKRPDRCLGMDDEPEQQALFQIEGPDEDGCVWICSAEGRSVWCENLGPKAKVAETLSQWLASIDQDENC